VSDWGRFTKPIPNLKQIDLADSMKGPLSVMKKLLALSIATVMCLGIASHAFALANSEIELALDVQLKSKTRTCAAMATTYSSCSAINRSASVAVGPANLDVVAVVYHFTGITAVEFGLDWGSTSYIYSPVWAKCADLEITRVGLTDFSTALVWTACKAPSGAAWPGTGGTAAGFLRFNVFAAGPSPIRFRPSDNGVITSVDCQFDDDEVHTTHDGFHGGALPGPTDLDPCALGPTATEAKTWSGVKALYR